MSDEKEITLIMTLADFLFIRKVLNEYSGKPDEVQRQADLLTWFYTDWE